MRPDVQGKGYGRVLLTAVHTIVQTHSTSLGIALDAETPQNVSLSKQFGYGVVAETDLEGVPVWCMFRSNERR